jgi:hypothetical protein
LIVAKKEKSFRRATPQSPRFIEKSFSSATLGDFGEFRRMSF